MASLRKLRKKWYIRERRVGLKEKLWPTDTSERRFAEIELSKFNNFPDQWKREHGHEIFGREMSISLAVGAFMADCRRNNLRPATLVSYNTSLGNFLQVTGETLRVSYLTQKMVYSLIEMLRQRGLKYSSVNVNLRSIRTFLNWLYAQRHIREKIEVKLVHTEEVLPKILTEDEITRIYAKVTNKKILASFRVYERLGIRASELSSVRREGSFLHISAFTAKGRRERIIPLPADLIEDYELATTKPYTPMYLSKQFLKYRRMAGVAEGKTLHSLRHTFAATSLIKSDNIHLVKQMLGHRDVQTTERYLRFPKEYLKELLAKKFLVPSAIGTAEA